MKRIVIEWAGYLLGILLFGSGLPEAASASDLMFFFSPMTDQELCAMFEAEEAISESDALIKEEYKSFQGESPHIKIQRLEEFIQKKVQENPNSIEWCGIYSQFCFFRGTPQKAYSCLKRACEELQTQTAQAWFLLAALEREFLKNHEKAYICIRRAVELKPDDPSSLFLLGTFLEQDGKYAESIQCFTKAIKATDDAPEGHAYRAVNYIHLGEHAKAAADLERALSGDWARNPDCYLYLVGCYLYLKQKGKAIDLLNRAAEQFPRETAFPLIRFLIQDRKGDEPLPEKLFTPGIQITFKPEERI